MTSRRDLILDALMTRLATITVANGFNTDLGLTGGAQEPVLPYNELVDLPVAIVSMPSEDKEETRATSVDCRLLVEITLVPDQQEGAKFERAIDDLVEDVERVILAELEADPAFGVPGCFEPVLVGHRRGDVNNAGLLGGQVQFTVRYRHDLTDPRTYGGVA